MMLAGLECASVVGWQPHRLTHSPDTWLAVDKGDGSNQARWCSLSNRLAWACSHSGDCRSLQSSKRGQGPVCKYFCMSLLVSWHPHYWPKQVTQPRMNLKVILYLLRKVTLREPCRQGREEFGATSADNLILMVSFNEETFLISICSSIY